MMAWLRHAAFAATLLAAAASAAYTIAGRALPAHAGDSAFMPTASGSPW